MATEAAPDAAAAETFPGESSLPEEERTRRLILHFSLPRTITTCDPAEGRCTDEELNHVLASMAWGTLDANTTEWMIESNEPSLDAPHESSISYTTYIQRTYPTHSAIDESAREENRKQASARLGAFTESGEPGAKFRAQFEQMEKCLAYSPVLFKALAKQFANYKVCLKEEDVPEDPSREETENMVRFGRHRVLPAFWSLLNQLTKDKRWFSVVFRTFGDDVPVVQQELKYFCAGQHPCFNGANKTQKPLPMNGEKGSHDMRLPDEYIGFCNRTCSRLEFAKRDANRGKKKEAAEEKKEDVPTEGIAGEIAPAKYEPTVYEYPPYHTAYAGLMHQILEESNTAAIVDDRGYWEAKDRDAQAGKLLLVDNVGGPAETKVQHIFFDGHIQADDAHCLDVRDVVSGETIPLKEAKGVFAHRVDFYQAVIDPDYFIKAVAACEQNMSERIVESKRVKDKEDAWLDPKVLKDLPPKQYLYRTVIPALLPALEACQRDRPKDPITFIAFYMLRHQNGYSKSLSA